MTREQVDQNIALLQELVSCNNNISLWCFDGTYDLLYSTSPHEAVFSTAFSFFGCKDYLRRHSEESFSPVTVSTPLNLNWVIAYEHKDGIVQRVWALGPSFSTDVSFESINQVLQQFYQLDMNIPWKQALMSAMESVPVLSQLLSNYMTVMLHYCVTGEKLRISDIHFQRSDPSPQAAIHQKKNRNNTWAAERNLLRMIREGDLNYREALAQCSSLSGGVPVHSADPLRQAKDSVIVSISIYCRAAIEGGLSPELGYAIGDAYIQSVENCTNVSDAGAIHAEMLEDFVQRVHKCRNRPNISQQIRACCDYIETHPEEALTLAELSKLTGYSDYYLSRKFKAEMDVSVSDYIKIARCERAKFLLAATDVSIPEIASRLRFCSRSHFGDVFRRVAGCTPAEYREKGGE